MTQRGLRAIDRREDVPQIRAALDNQRTYQRHGGLWKEVHEFAPEEMRVFRGGEVLPSDDPDRIGGILLGGIRIKTIKVSRERKS